MSLFFGVELETQIENSKSAYNLKVSYIVFIPVELNNVYP